MRHYGRNGQMKGIMKPFNLEEYLKNPERKVVTRDGRDVRIHCTNYGGLQPIIAEIEGIGFSESFTKYGGYYNPRESRNDLFFAPEKETEESIITCDNIPLNQSWGNMKVEKFDLKTLHPFDKVLAKDGFSSKWTCSFFSHMDNDVSFPVYCSGGYFKVCIPYNEETKHLVGASDDCPEYYKWWEE